MLLHDFSLLQRICNGPTRSVLLEDTFYTDITMYGIAITYSKGKDQPGKVANPARGQLNRENECSTVLVRAGEFGLARRVQPSRPASACSFSILRLNLVLTYKMPPEFRGGVHLCI